MFQSDNKEKNHKKSNDIVEAENSSNKSRLNTKCQSKLHLNFSKNMLKLFQMGEEINASRTLKLISLLPWVISNKFESWGWDVK